MASIPGPFVLVVGLIVSIFSFFLNKKSFAFIGAYSLFLYLGIILILYGFVKVLIWYMTRKSDEEKKIEADKLNQQNNPKQYTQAQNQQRNQGSQMQTQTSQLSAFDEIQKRDYDEDRYRVVIRCQNCGMNHYIYSNFCSNCGARLPKQ